MKYGTYEQIVGAVRETPNGNIILEIGETTPEGWVKIAHVVLTPSEAGALGSELMARTIESAQA